MTQKIQLIGWQPIETAPQDTRKMFVVRGFNVDYGGPFPYTTDPWCVWRSSHGGFERWPHSFPPTHWMPLPELEENPSSTVMVLRKEMDIGMGLSSYLLTDFTCKTMTASQADEMGWWEHGKHPIPLTR